MSNLISWPAPPQEIASPDYTVTVDGTSLFVYQARVRAEILPNDGLWTHVKDPAGQRASFVIFDQSGQVSVVVTPSRSFTTARIFPTQLGITPVIAGGKISFELSEPHLVTILLDDDDTAALHIFASAPEVDVPSPDDPNVLYFGPGLHEINQIKPVSGQTVYLAGGAVVKAKLGADEKGTWSEQWKVTFYHGAVLDLTGLSNVRVCGRGILDASMLPHPAKPMIVLKDSSNIRLEGIMLRDSSNWNVIIGKSNNVRVNGLKLISGRLNSDGINSVNSHNVEIRNCFVRNHDDSIVVKTTEPELPAKDITVEDCIIWNDWGFALGATYETRAAIRNLNFHRCDVIYSRHWCMGIHVSDSETVADVHFRDITIDTLKPVKRPEDVYDALTTEPKLLKMVIQQDCWGKDDERGHIRNVILENITVNGTKMLASEMFGADAEHDIKSVAFKNIHLAGQEPIKNIEDLRLESNEFVSDVRID
ncbi:MAG: glycosyl hydrolase family 28 protein [bacterium]